MDQSLVCPCGSGLRRASCCEADLAALCPPAAIRHLTPLIDRAAQAHQEGASAAAEELCHDILELAPGHTDALALMFLICKETGRTAAAEALIGRLVRLDPNNFSAVNEITLLLLGKGNLQEAEQYARHAVRIAPEVAQAHNLVGMVLTEAHKPRVGEHHYRRVLSLSGRRDPILLANLAWNLKTQGRMAEARALYQESISAAPNILQTLLGWAHMEEADRNFDAAAALLDRAERVSSDNPSVLLSRAVLLGRTHHPEQALAVLDRIARQDREGSLGPSELMEKGRLLDQMGQFDDAWGAFVEGKRRLRQLTGCRYLAEHAKQLANRLKQFFIAPRLKILPRAAEREAAVQPLFILGFPRSGTTLVEQILSSHPRIGAGDELPLIWEIADLVPRMFESPLSYPEALAELWMGDRREGLDHLRTYYMQKASGMGVIAPGKRWFTDKMPLNETHLGLIALIFPMSPLVHVLRHPLDTVLSAFANELTHGFFCAYEPETAARHLVLIHDLVAHYRAEMPLRYLAVRYEDLVGDHTARVQSMLDFVGAGFDERCLRFHENRRYARTASYAQVSEPLYTRSRFRYRNYLRHLEPVIPILRPVMELLGYSV